MKLKIDSDIFFASFCLGMLFLLVVPMPSFIIDILLTVSIAMSALALLMTLFVDTTLDLSSFPTLLLFLTLFRLGLNIASTRLILSRGEAGHIIDTFGAFVTSGNTLIGLIVFSILTVINFIVITKGAGRIAEVAARFTLEALPGKQMAIESDLSSGIISQEGAKEARKKLIAESEFYGSMDGSAKFIRGDAIATVLIALINIFGGFFVGCFMHHKSAAECFSQMTRLTVGEGLVSQIPALMLSIAAGVLLTRNSKEKVSSTLLNQLMAHPKVIAMCGGMVLFLSFVPGMPFLVMGGVSLLCFFTASMIWRKRKVKILTGRDSNTSLENAMIAHPIVVELGADRLDLANPLLEWLPTLRQEVLEEIGFVVPSIHIRDNLSLNPSHFTIKIKNIPVFTGHDEERELKINLKHNIIKHAHQLITRQDVAKMIEIAKVHDAAVVEELVPHKIPVGQILKVLQNLLKEGLPITDFISILEIIADHVSNDGKVDSELLTEHVRQGLSVQFLGHLFGPGKVIHAVTFDPKVEQMITAAYRRSEFGSFVALRPATIAKIEIELKRLMGRAHEQKLSPAIVTSVQTRRSLCALLEKYLHLLPILSYEEISESVEVRPLGNITNEVLL